MAEEKIMFEVIEDSPFSKQILRPSDIKTKRSGDSISTLDSFGKYQLEAAAGGLVAFFRKKGNAWTRFSIHELCDFYSAEKLDTQYMLFGLMGWWFNDRMMVQDFVDAYPFVVRLNDGSFAVTDLFLERCKKSKAVEG